MSSRARGRPGPISASLFASDGEGSDFLGCSVAISGDTIVAGANLADYFGSAYVFTRVGTTWSQQTKLLGSRDQMDAISATRSPSPGDTVVVGEPWGVDAAGTYGGGRASTSSPAPARHGASRRGCSLPDEPDSKKFGYSVAIDGDTVIAGAPHLYLPTAGEAYLFTRSGAAWTERSKIVPSDGEAGDFFGGAVAISGHTLIAGAPRWSHEVAGAAYVFSRYMTPEDTPFTISAPGVLGNDSDGDGDPITALIASQPSHGTVNLNADGSLTYTPQGNFSGTDSFTYRADDKTAQSAPALVTIEVRPVNDPPVPSRTVPTPRPRTTRFRSPLQMACSTTTVTWTATL